MDIEKEQGALAAVSAELSTGGVLPGLLTVDISGGGDGMRLRGEQTIETDALPEAGEASG